MKYIISLVLAFVTFFCNPSESVVRGYLKVGLMSFYPPFESRNALHQSYGFDVAVMQAICKQIGRTCVFYPMSFEDLFPSLDNNTVDAIVSAILITKPRLAHYEMTIPYHKANMSFLTMANNNLTISQEGLAGKSIGTIKGTIFVDYILKNFPNSKLIPYDTANSTLYNLSKGNVDVILLDFPNARWWVMNGNNQFKLAGEPIPVGDYGIALKKGNLLLLNQLNMALQTLVANGTIQQIANNYLTFSQ